MSASSMCIRLLLPRRRHHHHHHHHYHQQQQQQQQQQQFTQQIEKRRAPAYPIQRPRNTFVCYNEAQSCGLS